MTKRLENEYDTLGTEMQLFTRKILNITSTSIGLQDPKQMTCISAKDQEEIEGYIRTAQIAIQRNLDILEQEIDRLNVAY